MSNASYPRAERVRAALRHALADEVRRLKDPRVGFVTITDVTISPDLRHAKVYYTVFGEEADREATGEGLRHATSHLRSVMAREVRLRFAPTLEFTEDPIPERARHLEQLIAEIHKDEEDGDDDHR